MIDRRSQNERKKFGNPSAVDFPEGKWSQFSVVRERVNRSRTTRFRYRVSHWLRTVKRLWKRALSRLAGIDPEPIYLKVLSSKSGRGCSEQIVFPSPIRVPVRVFLHYTFSVCICQRLTVQRSLARANICRYFDIFYRLEDGRHFYSATCSVSLPTSPEKKEKDGLIFMKSWNFLSTFVAFAPLFTYLTKLRYSSVSENNFVLFFEVPVCAELEKILVSRSFRRRLANIWRLPRVSLLNMIV